MPRAAIRLKAIRCGSRSAAKPAAGARSDHDAVVDALARYGIEHLDMPTTTALGGD
jgi:hypothetical protein